jgi:hypothetical protein
VAIAAKSTCSHSGSSWLMTPAQRLQYTKPREWESRRILRRRRLCLSRQWRLPGDATAGCVSDRPRPRRRTGRCRRPACMVGRGQLHRGRPVLTCSAALAAAAPKASPRRHVRQPKPKRMSLQHACLLHGVSALNGSSRQKLVCVLSRLQEQGVAGSTGYVTVYVTFSRLRSAQPP